MAMHIQECSRINRRTIVVFEDCEATLSSRNNSAILNFLDGIDRPNIENGAVVMMTTKKIILNGLKHVSLSVRVELTRFSISMRWMEKNMHMMYSTCISATL